jgi:hypothetical protein
LEEGRGQSPRCWWVKITASNRGKEPFSRKCFWKTFDRQVAIEVFDDKGVLCREDLSHIQNGALSMESTFVLPAGGSKTDEIAFMPECYLGQLPSGTYYLRAYFAEDAEWFVASEPFKIILEKQSKTSGKAVALGPNLEGYIAAERAE